MSIILKCKVEESKKHKLELFLKEEYFNLIEKCIKTADARLNNKRNYKDVRIGDTILFCCKEKRVLKEVTEIKTYKCFTNMLKNEGKVLLPHLDLEGEYGLERGLKVYKGFEDGHYGREEKKYGAIVFFLKKV